MLVVFSLKFAQRMVKGIHFTGFGVFPWLSRLFIFISHWDHDVFRKLSLLVFGYTIVKLWMVLYLHSSSWVAHSNGHRHPQRWLLMTMQLCLSHGVVRLCLVFISELCCSTLCRGHSISLEPVQNKEHWLWLHVNVQWWWCMHMYSTENIAEAWWSFIRE